MASTNKIQPKDAIKRSENEAKFGGESCALFNIALNVKI